MHRLGTLAPLALLVLTGCLRDVGPGPFIGKCAVYPDGVYTWGDIGIGTCLAGPTDIRFVRRNGKDMLAVTNADPYLNFSSGSLLLIDWDSVDFDAGFNLMHELDAEALPMESYVGGLGWVEDRDLMLVSARLSEGRRTRSARDDLFVVDLAQDELQLWSEGGRIRLEDDPQPIVVDDDSGRAYVVNLTDHSVSVVDTVTTPLQVVDVAGFPSLEQAVFDDADDSGSLASMGSLVVSDVGLLANDRWSVDFIDGTYRLWVPAEGEGLTRYTSPGNDFWQESPLGIEVNTTSDVVEVADPVIATLDGNPVIYFASDGLLRVVVSTGVAGDWVHSEIATLFGDDWDAVLGGPSVGNLDNTLALFYDGRTDDEEPASIGIAVAEDGTTFSRTGDPVLVPPDGLSYEDPFVRPNDPVTNDTRMWLSVYDGANWTIGLTTSADGFEWAEVDTVLEIPGGHAAAPVVTYAHGRFRMWFTTRDDSETGWFHASAWSYDGRNWNDVTIQFASDEPFDELRPPRAALQSDPRAAWRVEGDNAGSLITQAFAGSTFLSPLAGFSFDLAAGQAVDNESVPGDRAINGMAPGSFAVVDGVDTLYVTGLGGDLQNHIHVLQRDDAEDDWEPAAVDVLGTGAESPVIYGSDGDWRMYFSSPGSDGSVVLREATSPDGLTWTRESGRLLAAEEFDSVTQRAHSIEQRDDDTVRLWFTGFDGTRERIGAAEASLDDDGDPGRFRHVIDDDTFLLGPGQPGDFDDSAVKDPMVFVDANGDRHMYYAGFDGAFWHLGYALVRDNDTFVRRTDPISGDALPALSGLERTFSAGGTASPVFIGEDADGRIELAYAGTDFARERLGAAFSWVDDPSVVFSAQRFPTLGDRLTFDTSRGDYDEDSVIELAQSVAAFTSTGEGASAAVLDSDRGFLYVISKLSSLIYVIDIRDDSNSLFTDSNYLDLEAVIRVNTTLAAIGFRDALIMPGTDRMYLTSRVPDGVVVIDLGVLEDNAEKEQYDSAVLGALPVHSLIENEGPTTSASIGGSNLLLAPDGKTLLMTHFRQNAIYAYDTSLGAYGELVGHVPWVGENPHVMRTSPDGRYAVVANYVGEIDEFRVSSTLAVLDLETMEIVTWLGNLQ